MRDRSTVTALFMLLATAGCHQQRPDVVLIANEIDSVAGMSGDGIGDASACDQPLLATSEAFLRVANDGCSYDWGNTQLQRLLERHIFQQPPAMLTPEALGADPGCNLLRMLAGPGLRYEGWRPDPDITKRVICPEYCAALRKWLDDHDDVAANCLPDDGS